MRRFVLFGLVALVLAALATTARGPEPAVAAAGAAAQRAAEAKGKASPGKAKKAGAQSAQQRAQAEAQAPKDPLEAHAQTLRERYAGHGLTVVVEAPFVVVGDEKPAKVKSRAQNTVRWAVRLLKQEYFTNDPSEIIEVWMFATEKSYRKGAKAYFGDTPDTPYGYYSPSHKAMVMNIGPGAGTLVHEIVHPYMEANFPSVPSWFNEGLASLYEYPVEVKGRIRGKVNWRLRGLKKELKSGHRRSFESLMATSSEDFYDAPDDTYAQARYLMYYLQEKGLLVAFYQHFLAHRGEDPTGVASLKAVLGRDDLDEVYREWVVWVQKLEE
jgi:hypothetical protein